MRGGTLSVCVVVAWDGYFNPPTPCGVGQAPPTNEELAAEFQSTHPVRGGTVHIGRNPKRTYISIHPPRAGWDVRCPGGCAGLCNFNPPTPCGVGPRLPADPRPSGRISIHPPRAGWDPCSRSRAGGPGYFNPPTPCGVGQHVLIGVAGNSRFQSTHPVRGGT